MASTASESNLQIFLGYFEEPEPGVPDGFTGWYHTSGKFPLRSAEQVFTLGTQARGLIRDEVAGPFSSQADAAGDLQAAMDR